MPPARPRPWRWVGMVLVAKSADRRRERRWHIAIPAAVGALGLVLSVTWAHDTALAMAALTLATFGILIVMLLVFGSLWIMSNLNENMMPMSADEFMRHHK